MRKLHDWQKGITWPYHDKAEERICFAHGHGATYSIDSDEEVTRVVKKIKALIHKNISFGFPVNDRSPNELTVDNTGYPIFAMSVIAPDRGSHVATSKAAFFMATNVYERISDKLEAIMATACREHSRAQNHTTRKSQAK